MIRARRPLDGHHTEDVEERETREHLEAEATDKAYMEELRRLYLERVEAEHRLYWQYMVGAMKVMDLCSSDSDGESGGNKAG